MQSLCICLVLGGGGYVQAILDDGGLRSGVMARTV